MMNKNSEGELNGRRPTRAEIDLDALAANFHLVRNTVGPQVRVMAVVKANAYGHGATRCAQRLAAEGADWLAVALPEEGVALREAGVNAPILVLGGFWNGQETLCLAHRLVPVIYRAEMAERLGRAAQDANVVADVHVKVDTGMGRLGVRYDEVEKFLTLLQGVPNLHVDGLMTHFAAADELERNSFTATQLARYEEALRLFRRFGHRVTCEHTANSAGAIAHPQARCNLVRPGGVLYGLWRDVLPPLENPPPFQPVMSVRTRIAHLKNVPAGETLGYGCTFRTARETLVATLPVGYNDGYTRALSNRGRVIVGAAFAPVVGRVSMDLTMIDVTDVAGVKVDDEVTLIGQQNGLEMTAEEVGQTAQTISYEITCGISERVPRVYVEKS